jgi:hypothetical protein
MILRGAAIHRDGHGQCGLLPTETFFRSVAEVARPHLAEIASITPHSRVQPNISCPAGTQERRGL